MLGALTQSVDAADGADPQWIWRHSGANVKSDAAPCYFRKVTSVDQPETGHVEISADNSFELFLNGRRVGTGDNWTKRYRFEVSRLLLPGRNVFAVAASNGGEDPAGLAAKITITDRAGKTTEWVTDKSWKWNGKPQGTWAAMESDDSQWAAAVELGAYGSTAPWGKPGELLVETSSSIPNRPRARSLGEFGFQNGDRVVLLGSAFTERLQYQGVFEALLSSAFPGHNITFRNLGWSGDTVWGDARAVFGTREDGFKRLIKDVAEANPTVILVCYGENEAFAGEAGIEEFRLGLLKLLETLEGTGARLVLIGPRQHESLGPPLPDATTYNASLARYRDVLRATAQEREHTFVDLYDSVPPRPEHRTFLSINGLHLTESGQALVAHELARKLGAPADRWSVSLDARSGGYDAIGTLIGAVRTGPGKVEFNAQSPRILASQVQFDAQAGNYRLIAPRRLQVRHLEDGQYELKIDGQVVARDSATKWSIGVDGIANPFERSQIESLVSVVDEKNLLYFHRYRPQNETYLFLFRKHEQGNNAVEIPQFDPLIAAKEKEIASLRMPKSHHYELSRVAP